MWHSGSPSVVFLTPLLQETDDHELQGKASQASVIWLVQVAASKVLLQHHREGPEGRRGREKLLHKLRRRRARRNIE